MATIRAAKGRAKQVDAKPKAKALGNAVPTISAKATAAKIVAPKATPVEMADNTLGKYFGIVDWLNSIMPYKRMAVWKDFFISPEKESSGKLPGIGEILKDLYVVSLIQILFYIISSGIPLLLITSQESIMFALISIVFTVLAYLLYPLLYLLYSVLEFAVAKAVGGKGNFSQNFAASALPLLAVFIILLPLWLLSIPVAWLSNAAVVMPALTLCMCILTLPFLAVSILIFLYSFYLKFVAFKKVHGISSIAAAAVVIVPIIIILIVAFALLALLAPYFAPLVALQQAQSGISP
jgi:hypothetical protein